MAWRSLVITKPARLSIHLRQLQVQQAEGETVSLPIEDISVLLIETPQALITSALLSALMENGTVLLTCDETHHPNGVMYPFMPHSRQARMVNRQIALSLPQMKRAWQEIIQKKLANQAEILRENGLVGHQLLNRLSKRVRSGDPDNYEGQGARVYFIELMGREFSRNQTRWFNSALNYGYAVVRAVLARSIAIYGMIPSLGIFHRNEQNAFNLADDLIEPFRPQVDRIVLSLYSKRIRANMDEEPSEMLTSEDKAALVGLLYTDIVMSQGKMNVLAAADRSAQSFGQVVEHADYRKLDLPSLAPLE